MIYGWDSNNIDTYITQNVYNPDLIQNWDKLIDNGYRILSEEDINGPNTKSIEDYYMEASEECERIGDLAELLGYDVTYDDEGICFIASKNDNEDVRKTKFFPIIQELVRLQSDVITVEHSFEDDEDYKNCFVIY